MNPEQKIEAIEATITALREARAYVDNAYECIFPDDARNAEVLHNVDAALISQNALLRQAKGITPVGTLGSHGWVFTRDPAELADKLLYVAPEAIAKIKMVRQMNSTAWESFPPSMSLLNYCMGAEARPGDHFELMCQLPTGQEAVVFRFAAISKEWTPILECDSLLLHPEATEPIGKMSADGWRIQYFNERKSVPEGTELYAEPLTLPAIN